MTLNWNSLKTAENGWKLDAAQRHRIYDNCLRGEKVGGFQWQFVWKPAAYLAAAAAVFMIALFLWQPKSEPKTVVTPGAAPAPIVPDSSAEGETQDQDAIEPEYTFDDYGQDAIYERNDGDVRSIYRAFLGMKTAPQKLAEDADLLMVQDDYMVYNQQGKLCVMNLKEGGAAAVVGGAAVRAIEGWEDHVLLYQIGANPGEYQTVLLTLSEQKRTVYEKDYYIADATRIGDTLYYTEWKYETTEGKELKAYSFADGSVETYCRIRTGSDPYEFYLADGRLYYLDEALMYCDLQTKETHQALKPVGFSDRYPCVWFKDRLYINTMGGFLIYDLKTQAVVYETTEAIHVCCSNQNGVVYYDSSKKEFTVIHADSSFTFDASGYESIYDPSGGGTVCEQGFALKYDNLMFFVKDPQNSSVSTVNGAGAARYDQWFAQHEFWETQGDMTFEESIAVIDTIKDNVGEVLTDEQRMALYLQACLQIDRNAPEGDAVDVWPASLRLELVQGLKGREERFVREASWETQGFTESFAARFTTDLLMHTAASEGGARNTYYFYEKSQTESAMDGFSYRSKLDMVELDFYYPVGDVIPTADLKAFYKKIIRYYLSLEGVALLKTTIYHYEGTQARPYEALTLEQVTELAKKGESLSYKDFDGYLFEEEPDRELRVYKIDEQYWVEVQYSEIEETTQSILLYANDVSPTMVVDLRGGKVADFVAEHENAAILTTVDAEWTRVSDTQSFTDFYQYAEKNGKVRYYEFEGEVVTPNEIIGAFVRFDTLEAYRAYAGEQADAKYDADFFKEKTLIILDSGYGVGNASRIQVGKLGKTLYISGLNGLGHIYATTDMMIYSLFCLEIPKDQLTDVETEEIRGMNFRYITDYER